MSEFCDVPAPDWAFWERDGTEWRLISHKEPTGAQEVVTVAAEALANAAPEARSAADREALGLCTDRPAGSPPGESRHRWALGPADKRWALIDEFGHWCWRCDDGGSQAEGDEFSDFDRALVARYHDWPAPGEQWAEVDPRDQTIAPDPHGMSTAWPISDVLTRLADAAGHLLDVHGCDGHGYEEVYAARDAARSIAAALASRAPDPRDQEIADLRAEVERLKAARPALPVAAQVRGLALALADALHLDPASVRLQRAVTRWLDAVDNAEALVVVAGAGGSNA